MPDDSKLTLTLRIHDATEKKDAAKSTAWSVVAVDRADLALSLDEFVDRYIKPAIRQDLAKFFELQNAK